MKIATVFNFVASHSLRCQALCSLLLQVIIKQLHFLHMEAISITKKKIFRQLVSAAMLFAKLQAGKRKLISDFQKPLFEQPID